MLKDKKPTGLRGFIASLWELARDKDPPHRISLGLALGIFIGFLPIMGIQMAVVTVFAIPLRGNLKAAIAGVWISNPITFIPLYYVNYRFGLLFFPQMQVSWNDFTGEMTSAANWDWTSIKSSALNMLSYGADILIPLWGGSTVLAVIFGLLTYVVTNRCVIYYRLKKSAGSK